MENTNIIYTDEILKVVEYFSYGLNNYVRVLLKNGMMASRSTEEVILR